uniref:Uncharacterized protein n=1 Tax=Arundo donax TaxID=35708 RepID=A0A0A9EXX9_ARUDO
MKRKCWPNIGTLPSEYHPRDPAAAGVPAPRRSAASSPPNPNQSRSG